MFVCVPEPGLPDVAAGSGRRASPPTTSSAAATMGSREGRIEEAELHVDLRGSLLRGSPSRGSPRGASGRRQASRSRSGGVSVRSARPSTGSPRPRWGRTGRSRSGTRSCQKHRSGTERPAPTHERSGADRLWIVEVARAADGVFERGDTGRFTGEVWLRARSRHPMRPTSGVVHFSPAARTHWRRHQEDNSSTA